MVTNWSRRLIEARLNRRAVLAGAARQQTKVGCSDERIKLISEGAGEGPIPDQDSRFQVAFLRPLCEVGGCYKGDSSSITMHFA
jgi:hypothetical protein